MGWPNEGRLSTEHCEYMYRVMSDKEDHDEPKNSKAILRFPVEDNRTREESRSSLRTKGMRVRMVHGEPGRQLP